MIKVIYTGYLNLEYYNLSFNILKYMLKINDISCLNMLEKYNAIIINNLYFDTMINDPEIILFCKLRNIILSFGLIQSNYRNIYQLNINGTKITESIESRAMSLEDYILLNNIIMDKYKKNITHIDSYIYFKVIEDYLLFKKSIGYNKYFISYKNF